MGKMGSMPGVMAFLRPFPVLEISTGATNQNLGQYAFSVSGVNGDQVYDVSTKLVNKLRRVPRVPVGDLRLLQQHAEPRHRHPPRPDQDVRRVRGADPVSPAHGLFAELPVPDQEAGRPVPGDPRGRGRGAVEAGEPRAALHQDRRREEHGPALRARQLEAVARAAVGQPPEPVHGRHDLRST